MRQKAFHKTTVYQHKQKQHIRQNIRDGLWCSEKSVNHSINQSITCLPRSD